MLTTALSQHKHFCQLQDAEWSTNPQPEVKNCGWQYFGRNSCGWAPWRVAACVDLSVFHQSPPVQKAYRAVSEWEWRARKSGKLPLALPQRRDFPLLRPRVCLTFPKQNTELPNSSLHFPPTASHILPSFKNQTIAWILSICKSILCCSPPDTVWNVPPDKMCSAPPSPTPSPTLPVCLCLHLLLLSGMFLLALQCTMVTRVTSFFLAGQEDGRERRETVAPTNQGAGCMNSNQLMKCLVLEDLWPSQPSIKLFLLQTERSTEVKFNII